MPLQGVRGLIRTLGNPNTPQAHTQKVMEILLDAMDRDDSSTMPIHVNQVVQGDQKVAGGRPQGFRLSHSSTDAVSIPQSSDLFYVLPYRGDRITVYQGGKWKSYQVTSAGGAVPSVADKANDVFIGVTAANTLYTRIIPWTDSTTRAQAIECLEGTWVNASKRSELYAGCIARGASYIDHIWNAFNRTPEAVKLDYSTASWAGSTGWRALNNDSSASVVVCCGVDYESSLHMDAILKFTVGNYTGSPPVIGTALGLNSTSSVHADCVTTHPASYDYFPNETFVATATLSTQLTAGFYRITQLERTTNTPVTFLSSSNAGEKSGARGVIT